MADTLPGGTLTLADDLTITRMGYGAMQLAGPNVFGPPKDRDQAIAVLRAAVDAQQVALAWLLQRSPAMVLIPDTSSPAHLRENIAAATLELSADAIAELDSIAA
jgi:aryl-alcohol dehydrogenase-like predicted oxidoreductase